MASGLLVRFQPAGPWRLGPASGARDAVDSVWRSDAVYSAICSAMLAMGELDAWLEATALSDVPAVVLSSGFPFHRDTLFVTPPRTLWPPPSSTKVRWKSARLIPLPLVALLLSGESLEEERWYVDALSECLLPVEKQGPAPPPFRVTARTGIALDRLGAGSEAFSTACFEFAEGAGMWCASRFRDQAAASRWREVLEGCFRYLADTGVGGERSHGWGRASSVSVRSGEFITLGLPDDAPVDAPGLWWMLSLFSPSGTDSIDWRQGSYSLQIRSGRAAGSGALKKSSRVVEEGSVLAAAARPVGAAHDVAPESSPHPVFRAGFAFAVALAQPAASPEVQA